MPFATKRTASSSDASDHKRLRADTIRLSVGGRVFQTAPETLVKAEYFQPILHGRIGHAVDDSGAFFIDRDGDLFGIILQWLRTYDRPSQRTLERYGDALLEECRFYGEETLPQVIRGDLAPNFYLKAEDRAILEEEDRAREDKDAGAKLLIDVHAVDTTPRERALLEQPLILDKTPRPQSVVDFRTFYTRLNALSAGVLAELRGIPNLVFAGGAVVAALTNGHASDIDIFLTCDPKDGEQRLRDIYAGVQRAHATRKKKQRFMVTRSKCAVTFFLSSVPSDTLPIQVITATHASTQDVILNFDVDCCCFAYAPSEGERVVCTRRGLRALRYAANVMDGRFASNSYSQRLEKYAQRGYAIAIPGYKPERVSRELLTGTYAEYGGYKCVLFQLGPKEHRMDTVEIAHANHSLVGPTTVTKELVSVAARQAASVVHGLRRLIVRDRLASSTLEAPELQFCHRHGRSYVDKTKLHDYCTPISTGIPGQYVLLWGVTEAAKHPADGAESSMSEDDEGDDPDAFYERTPLLRIYNLMQKHTHRLLEGYIGGALNKGLAHRVAIGCIRGAYEQVTAMAATSIKTGSALQLVYDIVPEGASFELALAWIRDSRRSPLQQNLTDAEYEAKYGLAPRLTFTKRERRTPVVSDFWAGIY